MGVGCRVLSFPAPRSCLEHHQSMQIRMLAKSCCCKVQGPDHLDYLEAAAPLLLQEHFDVELAIRQVSSPSLLLRHRARFQSVNDKEEEDANYSKENAYSGAAGPFLYFGVHCFCSLYFCSRLSYRIVSAPDGAAAYSKANPQGPAKSDAEGLEHPRGCGVEDTGEMSRDGSMVEDVDAGECLGVGRWQRQGLEVQAREKYTQKQPAQPG